MLVLVRLFHLYIIGYLCTLIGICCLFRFANFKSEKLRGANTFDAWVCACTVAFIWPLFLFEMAREGTRKLHKLLH